MEITVIRDQDQRRMVVAVDAATEAEALRTIVNAIGPVSMAREELTGRKARGEVAERHARVSRYF
ncbi:hypothetical protein [Leifsonia sp. fls2-241-R2A-40a]|uniref:hypothetical protein n=1 Tax=Leifsonia sp. fls2-241-R2A-40a TaxID=3040290 RepID=UPI00254C1173|nr:hypothetical protein [Leifsonia sp. fls2-241-R2A-40a]